jgi:hypothetical protein
MSNRTKRKAFKQWKTWDEFRGTTSRVPLPPNELYVRQSKSFREDLDWENTFPVL